MDTVLYLNGAYIGVVVLTVVCLSTKLCICFCAFVIRCTLREVR